MTSQPIGYSGAPLAKKLGISNGARIRVKHAPAEYAQWLEPIPPGVIFEKKVSQETDIVHVFALRKAELANELDELRTRIRSTAAVWVSWPKKSSKAPTDITEDTVRELALPLGFVDIKVCAVSEVWSGLKLVIRKPLR